MAFPVGQAGLLGAEEAWGVNRIAVRCGGEAATQWGQRDRGHFFRSSNLDGEVSGGD